MINQDKFATKKLTSASIIILTWNGRDFITGCLDSVFAQNYSDFEVIVVDNASTDDTVELVVENYPAVQLIENDKNLGFAAGMNVGLRQASGEFLVLLNQDTVVAPNWLSALMTGMQSDKQVGIGGCKIYNWSGEKIWHAGVKLSSSRLIPIHVGEHEADFGQFDQTKEVDAVTGAAMGIRRSVLDKIGYLDEHYGMYFEDTDFCLRARQSGYTIVYFPQAQLKHYVGGSLGQGTFEVLYRYHMSRLLFVLRNYDNGWFSKSFVPAEKEYLQHQMAFNEFKALRRAYVSTAIKIARNDPSYITHIKKLHINTILQSLNHLCDSSINVLYDPEDWSMSFQWEKDVHLELFAFKFCSNIPVLGVLLSVIRRLWASIAAKWIERHLINQQNAINQQLKNVVKEQLAIQTSLITVLNADITYLNEQLVQLSRDQANLSTEKYE